MDFRVFSRNISEYMHARCVQEDTKQTLKGNLQADGVQSRQTLFVRYCPMATSHRKGAGFAEIPSKASCRIGKNANFPKIPLTFSCKNRIIKLCIVVREEGI